MSSIISKLINLAGNITGVLGISNGGTNSSTALNNNRFMVSSGGAIGEAASVTASRVVVSDTNGLPAAASTSTTQVNYLSSATGTTGTTNTNIVFSTSPTLVTPVLGTPASGNLSNCTSYPNVTQSTAGLVASAGQLLGTNTNDTASAGNVGELKGPISRVYSAKTSISTGSTINVCATTTSITLTEGDWDVSGSVGFEFSSGANAGGIDCGVSKTSAALPASDTLNVPTAGEVRFSLDGSAFIAGVVDTCINIPSYPVSVNTNTNYFLVATATFSVGTCGIWGSLVARRAR